MNWLQRTSEIWTPDRIIQGVLSNEFDGSGPSPTQPEGGWAYKEMKRIGPLPEVCNMINYTAGTNAAARSKMQVLAEAAGCQWAPQNPPQPQDQMQNPEVTPVMPMMGEQEKPMNMPSTQIE